jgi:serine/threonine-protein kinase HipA
MADRLAVWLYGTHVATIEENHGRLRLWYTPEALARFPPGMPLLSLSLPLIEQRFTHGVVRSFLDGLLPEANARRAAAERFNLRARDTYGLIRTLGRDCAGAIVIQPEDGPAPSAATTHRAAPITESALASRVANLSTAPLGVDAHVRLSLAGAQEKLVLTRLPDGTWGLPIDGTPSTHILKPEIPTYPQTVENEAFCMRLAKHLELSVAEVETTTIGNQRLIVVQRYDRIVHPDGSVERIHQEDLCQALGLPPEKKYQEDGGPSLHAVADLLATVAEPASLEALVRAVTLNVVIGNGDAHGKNFSLLHDSSGVLRLAPLYDLVSTLAYDLDHLAMSIDTVQRIDRVTADRIVNEATSWGMARDRAEQIVSETLGGIPEAADAAFAEIDGVPARVRRVVDEQLAVLGGQRPLPRRGGRRSRRATPASIAAIRS